MFFRFLFLKYLQNLHYGDQAEEGTEQATKQPNLPIILFPTSCSKRKISVDIKVIKKLRNTSSVGSLHSNIHVFMIIFLGGVLYF